MRLQKYLSQAGISSRRQAEKYILAGLVKINGRTVIRLGTKVDPQNDRVTFRNRPVEIKNKFIYIALHKPVGVVTSCRQKGEIPVTLLIKGIKERIFPVGRLDKETSGLLLLTNDGDFAYRLTHPKFQHEKEYLVSTLQKVSARALAKLSRGVKILEKTTRPAKISRLSPQKFRIILTEGLNRQIHRMFRKIGVQVKSIHRLRINQIELGDLEPGQWRKLPQPE